MRPALTPWGWLAHYWWTGKKMSTFSTRVNQLNGPWVVGPSYLMGSSRRLCRGKARADSVTSPDYPFCSCQDWGTWTWSPPGAYAGANASILASVFTRGSDESWLYESAEYRVRRRLMHGIFVPWMHFTRHFFLPHNIHYLLDEWRDCVYSSHFSDSRVSVTRNRDFIIRRWRIHLVFKRKPWDNGHTHFVLLLKQVNGEVRNSWCNYS